jgi:hypothetical protein
MSNPNLLALLKRIEWTEYQTNYGDSGMSCVECGNEDFEGHETNCELKAQIDRLEAEQASERNEGRA